MQPFPPEPVETTYTFHITPSTAAIAAATAKRLHTAQTKDLDRE